MGIPRNFSNLAPGANTAGVLGTSKGGTGSTSTTFVNLATNVTGTLPIANGGTGLSTVGTNGQVLQSNGSALVYVTPSSGTQAFVAFGSTGGF